MNINENLINELVDIIYQKIEAKFNKNINQNNIEFYSEGIVKSVNNDAKTAVIQLSFCDTDELPNLTGDSLSIGDKVKVF